MDVSDVLRELEAERNQVHTDNKNLHAELHRLKRQLKETNHQLELALRKAEEMKQYHLDTQRLQELVKKKEDQNAQLMSKCSELNNQVNRLNEEKRVLEAQVKTDHSDLREAEKEIYRLRLVLEEKVVYSKEQIHAMKEVDARNQLLTHELAEMKNCLQIAKMHEESLRRRLTNADNVEADLVQRNRDVVKLKEELKAEMRTKEGMTAAMREMQKGNEAACVQKEKAQMQMEIMRKEVDTLTQELAMKNEENTTMRHNIKDIRRDLEAFKNGFANTRGSLKHEMSGDSMLPLRQSWADRCENPRPYNRTKLINPYLSSVGRERREDAHSILSKYTATRATTQTTPFSGSLLGVPLDTTFQRRNETPDMGSDNLRRVRNA